MTEADFSLDLKTCAKCGERKARALFTIDSRSRRPRNPCKACALLQTNAWRNKNKDRVNTLARLRSKSEKCRTQLRERMKRFRRLHPDKKRAESLAWTQRRRELRLNQKPVSADGKPSSQVRL